MSDEFRFPVLTYQALGYDEATGDKKTDDDIAADLTLNDRYLEDYLTNFVTGGAGVGTARQEFDPTVTQSGAVTHTATYSEYRNFAGYITWTFYLTMTGAGTGNNTITLSLPATSDAISGSIVGQAQVVDTGAATYPAVAILASTTTVAFERADAGPTATIGQDPNFALASGDLIRGTITYPAAG